MKLIVCDLDETLLDDQKRISERNLEMIYKAQEQGNKFVLATGRGHCYLDYIMDELHVLNKDDEYLISNNGSVLIETKTKSPLYVNNINNDLAIQLIEFGFRKNLCVYAFTLDNIYVFDADEDELIALSKFTPQADVLNTHDIEFLRGKDIVKVMFQRVSMEYLMEIEKEIDEELKEKINIAYSSNRYMELNAKGVNKGSALLALLKHLNMSVDDVVAIGDNYNDLPMLELAGVGCAVNNASDVIKEKCNYVSDYSNNESAVAEIIERFVLNK